jgi:hypothetical protein
MQSTYRLDALLITLLLSLLALGGCSLFKPGPAKTVQNFYKFVEKGEIEEAKKLLSAQVLSTFGAKIGTALADETKKIKAKKGIDSFNVLQEYVTGDLAEIMIEVKYGNGTAHKEKTHLLKENGDWKITIEK